MAYLMSEEMPSDLRAAGKPWLAADRSIMDHEIFDQDLYIGSLATLSFNEAHTSSNC